MNTRNYPVAILGAVALAASIFGAGAPADAYRAAGIAAT